MFFDLKPGEIDAARTSPLGELFFPRNLMNQNADARNNWAKAHYKKTGHEFF
jgi:hypothetical protein